MVKEDMVCVTEIGRQETPGFISGNHDRRRYGNGMI